MKAYLMTRGTMRSMDYDFLGETPADRWWEEISDGGWMMLDYPEVAVVGTRGGAGVLVSGVPSRRRDVIGTAVRYTLVLTDAQEAPDVALAVACEALTPVGRQSLGALLDESFDAETVDALLGGGTAEIDVHAVLDTILRGREPGLTDPPGEDSLGSWAGDLDDPAARSGFVARARALIEGADGIAFTSHSLASIAGAQRAQSGLGQQVAILIVNGSDVDGVRPLGKAPAPVTTGPRAREGHSYRRLSITATGLGLAILILVWWWIRRS